MLCPRGRAFRGCPTSGSSTFLLMFFFLVSFSLSFFFFFQSPCKRLKISHHSVHPGSTIVEGCNWEGVALGPAAPVPSPEAVSKLAVKAFVRDLRFRNPVCFRAGNIHNFITKWEEVLVGQEKRAEILSYLRDGVDVNSFSPHIRATPRASFTMVPFHLAHVSLTANHVRSSRILSPPLFRSAWPMVPSPCGERWENAHLRIWLCH